MESGKAAKREPGRGGAKPKNGAKPPKPEKGAKPPKSPKKEQSGTGSARAHAHASACRARLMNTMLNPDNMDLPVRRICSIARVSPQTYYRATEDEGFMKEYRKRSKALIGPSVGLIINKLIDQAQAGDVRAIRLALEMDGMFVPEQKLTGDPDKPIPLDIPAIKDLRLEDLLRLAGEA